MTQPSVQVRSQAESNLTALLAGATNLIPLFQWVAVHLLTFICSLTIYLAEKGDNCTQAYRPDFILGQFTPAGNITTYLRKIHLQLLCTEFDINLVDKFSFVHSQAPTYVVPHLRRLPPTQYIKPSAHIRAYDGEDVFELLNSHVQALMVDHLVEIRKQMALKNLSPDLKSKPWPFHSWLYGLNSLKLASRCLRALIRTSSEQEQLDRNYEDACLPCLKQKLVRLQCSIFKASSGARTSPPVLLYIGNDNSDNPPTVQEDVSPP